METTTALRNAIESVGGTVALARSVGTPHYNVSKWLRRGVPPAFVLKVEQASGVSRHDLRPDIFGPAERAA